MNKPSNNKIPFGLKNGILVQISEVRSGLSCGCVCPSCKQNLQAKKGRIVSHHFSHDPSNDEKECKSACETAIHAMAKQILKEDGYLVAPPLSISMKQSDANGQEYIESISVEDEMRRTFDKVELEKGMGKIRPDVIGYANGQKLLIEVAVTHFSDFEKKQKFRKLGLHALEINLKSVDHTVTKEELRELINGPKAKKQWISNPNVINAKRELKARLTGKIQAINERIFRERARYLRKPKHQPLNATNRSRNSSIMSKSINKMQYKTRWFRCEACRNTFVIPTRDAPYTITSIACPKCAHAVSARLCMD